GRAARPLRLAAPAARPAPARPGSRPRVLFHAVNSWGLGHVVRLALLAGALGDAADTAMFTACRVADRFWAGRVCGVGPRLDERFTQSPEERDLLAFHLAVNRFAPDAVVFDSFWPYPVIGRLGERGIACVLVLAPLAAPMMTPTLRIAAGDF